MGTEVAHVTRDSDTTFKVERSKVNLQGRRHIVAASRTACCKCCVYVPLHPSQPYTAVSCTLLCPAQGALSDDARLTSVYLSRTSGLSGEQRGLGRLKLTQR